MDMSSEEFGNLVLNRRPGLSIQIGQDILVTYLGQDENEAARLRITAPKKLAISRVKFEEDQLTKQ